MQQHVRTCFRFKAIISLYLHTSCLSLHLLTPLGLLLPSGCCEWCCYECRYTNIWVLSFTSFRYVPRSRILGYGNSIFKFLRNDHIVFNILYMQEFQFIYNYLCTYFISSHIKYQSFFHSLQSLSHVKFFATPWTATCQASLFITNSQSLLKLISI